MSNPEIEIETGPSFPEPTPTRITSDTFQVNFSTVHHDSVPAEVRQAVSRWAVANGLGQAAGVTLNVGLRPTEAFFPKVDPQTGALVRENNGRGELLFDVVSVVRDCDPFPLVALPYIF